MVGACVLSVLALACGVWGLVARFRQIVPPGNPMVEPVSGSWPEVAPVGCPASGTLTAADRESRDRLLACLDGLFAEDDRPVATPVLMASSTGPLPPPAAAIVTRLSSGATGSAVLARLQLATAGPRVLAETIGVNPVLTGQVLKIANSPLFGVRCQVTSLEQAIGLLGLAHLRTLLYTELLEQAAETAGIVPGLRRSLWSHLGRTAVLARHIAPALAGLDAQTLHTVGLLHDIGRLVLGGPGNGNHGPGIAAEQAVHGVDHTVAGAAVCAGFHLPDTVCHGVRLHHAPCVVELEDLEADLTAIRHGLAVCIADRLAWALDDGGDSALPAAVRPSYRFLVNEAMLSRLVAEPELYVTLRQAMVLVGRA